MRFPSVDMVGTAPAISFSLKHKAPKNGWFSTSWVLARVSFHSTLLWLFIPKLPHLQRSIPSKAPYSPSSSLWAAPAFIACGGRPLVICTLHDFSLHNHFM